MPQPLLRDVRPEQIDRPFVSDQIPIHGLILVQRTGIGN
jgi:hypothetical protein